MKQDQFQRWKTKLSKRLTRVLLILCAPVIIYSSMVANELDWQVGLGAFCLLIVLSFSRQIPNFVKTYALIIMPMIIGTAILIKFGVVGGARLYFGLSILLAVVLLGQHIGNLFLIISVGLIAIVGTLSLRGFLEHDDTAYPLSQELTWWFWFGISFIISIGVAFYSVAYLIKKLEKNFGELESLLASKEHTIEAEKQSKELYQLLADNVTDVIWTMNLKLELTYVSPSVFAARGYTPEEVIQMGVSEMMVSIPREKIDEMLLTELENAEKSDIGKPILRIDTQLSHKDGHWVEVEFLLSFLRDEGGEIAGILGVSREIGDRKRLETAMDTVLSGTKQRYGIDFFDALTGKLQEALAVQMVFVGKVNEDKTISTLAVSEQGVKGENFSYDLENTPCQIVGQDGTCIYPSNIQSLFPKDKALVEMGVESYLGISIHDNKEQPIAILVAMDDKEMKDVQLGERLFNIFASHVRAEILRQEEEADKYSIQQQLNQAQKIESIGQLSGGIAHDFNNLLVVINGYVELAKEHLDDDDEEDEELNKYLSEIEKSANRATVLTRQLLSFSRRQIMELKPLNLNELIVGLSGLLTRLIPENIEYQFIPVSDLGTINADAGQLEQAIVNLAVNARDAMPDGGKLTIETENILIDQNYVNTHPWAKLGRYVLFRVSDTGFGISLEMQERIFEPFFTTKAEGEGTGLGLSVFFGIVKQHDGFTHLYSEVGKGSEFRTYLPIVERNAGSLERKLEPKLTRGQGLILIVEDEEQVCRLATTILTRAGYEVLAAEDGERAVEVFSRHHKDLSLVLLDVVLPKLDGRGVMKEIQNINADVPILFTSGYSSNGIHTNFILEDDLILLQKPYSAESLLRKVNSTIKATKNQ
ncbi:MAG: response regulator, partial [Pseudomonadales bacterium]|nr:response regulator [Pseudomonadales bacterium]